MPTKENEHVTEEQKRLEAEFAEFIKNHKWTFAKTYAAFCPHEYVVKTRLPKEEWPEFEKFVQFVRDYGWEAIYGSAKAPLPYYSMGEYYYWSMGEPLNECVILNRAKFENFDFYVDDFGDLRCRSKFSGGRRKS